MDVNYSIPAKVSFEQRMIAALAGIVILFAGTLLFPLGGTWFISSLIMIIFVAILEYYPITILHRRINLIHILAIGGSLIFGTEFVFWATSIGTVIGILVRLQRATNHVAIINQGKSIWVDLLYTIIVINIPLIIVFSFFNLTSGITESSVANIEFLRDAVFPTSIATLLQCFFLFIAHHFLRRGLITDYGKDLSFLGIVFFLPLPFELFIFQAYQSIDIGALIVLGGVLIIISILINGIESVRTELERRVQELSTLNSINKVLQSSLKLNDLLNVIHKEVTDFLEIENLYVALYDRRVNQVWYPIAVKQGVRQNWSPRPKADTFTERVIRRGEPLLMSQQILEQSANPLILTDVIPTAWMGVPLVSHKQTIGCLAVFSLENKRTFTSEDLTLLTLLSSHISIAIENALLYVRTFNRSRHLGTINLITKRLAASLDVKEILEHVCRSAIEIAECQKCAIFLFDHVNGLLKLNYSIGFSEEFTKQNCITSFALNGMTRCLQTNLPEIRADERGEYLDPVYGSLLKKEGVVDWGDFPLLASDVKVGFISVYFEGTHAYQSGEVELIQSLASHAAFAISNARLYSRTDRALVRRASQLEILESIGRELSTATYSDRLFNLILDKALEFTNSKCGAVDLYNSKENILEVKASRGYTKDILKFPVNQGISGRVFREKKALNVSNIRGDPDYFDLRGGITNSQLSVPIIQKGDVLGIITLESSDYNGFTSSDQAFVTQLAIQAATAVVNAELLSEIISGRDRLTAVLNTVVKGILMMDTLGNIVIANAFICSITALKSSELLGARLLDLHSETLRRLGFTKQEAKTICQELQERKLINLPNITYEIYSVHRERKLERETSPVWSKDERLIGLLVVIRDITEQHEIEEGRKLISETLVHDLRSPLSAVIGALDMISDSLHTENQEELISQSVRIAKRGSNRILRLIESMLDIARLQSGSIDIELNPISISSLVKGLMVEFVIQANDFGIILLESIPQDVPFVMGDDEKLTRVISNLIDNALKFTPVGGKVTVSAYETKDSKVAFRVHDTGPGIPDEYRERIFERFSQIPDHRGRRPGSGLGLAFCRSAIEAQGGRIWVESGEGVGSAFIFTLQIARMDDKGN